MAQKSDWEKDWASRRGGLEDERNRLKRLQGKVLWLANDCQLNLTLTLMAARSRARGGRRGAARGRQLGPNQTGSRLGVRSDHESQRGRRWIPIRSSPISPF
jgi:hypothetical protein